jgi:cellulose 1,4-beta-cellobiosidase
VDEIQYADAWYAYMSAKFPGIGMLIDTSRNGWGGPDRPQAASTSTDVNVFVDESRIDRRWHRGNWCNNKYAGVGARPTAAPQPNYDAFVWINPPGESDGVSQPGIIDPEDPNKTFDVMCDPNGLNIYCNCGFTDARPAMPHWGRWSTAFFQQLLTNAYPPVN